MVAGDDMSFCLLLTPVELIIEEIWLVLNRKYLKHDDDDDDNNSQLKSVNLKRSRDFLKFLE